MAETSLTNSTESINSDIMYELVCKAKALTDVALTAGVLEYPPATLYNYFWVLSDLIDKMSRVVE